MSPHFLGALFHSDEKDGTLLRATNAMRAASLWDGMAELSDSQIWTALAGANGTAERKPLWGDSIELAPGTTLRTGGCCSSPLWSQAECCPSNPRPSPRPETRPLAITLGLTLTLILYPIP